MNAGEAYALKKCRYIFFSWYCNTGLYSTFKLNSGDPALGSSWLMISDLYDLTKNTDHSYFKRNSRTKNSADGSTSLYLVKESGIFVLVYFLGLQSSASAPRFQDRINEGHKLEYRQLVDRVTRDLKISRLP